MKRQQKLPFFMPEWVAIICSSDTEDVVDQLLRILADGKFHSGDELGEALGVSRAAVWKQVGRLIESGLEIESVKGKGYCLAGGLDLLDESEIFESISPYLRGRDDLMIFSDIDSTNRFLMRSPVYESCYRICLAERQTEGRGRRGRIWQSPFAKNIYLSVGFYLKGGVGSLEGLSLALGVMVAEYLSTLGVSGVQLKWPNDVWLDGKKVCGILVELQGQPDIGWYVVAGIGLNVHMRDAPDIDQPWTSLSGSLPGRNVRRSSLASELLKTILSGLDKFSVDGFGGYHAKWREYDCLEGKYINVLGGERSGIAAGIDVSGNLLLNIDGDILPVQAGEVSVRLCANRA